MGWGGFLGDIVDPVNISGQQDNLNNFDANLTDSITDDLTSGVNTVRNAVGDAGQYIGDAIGNSWQQTYNNIDNYWKDYLQMLDNNNDTIYHGLKDNWLSGDPKKMFAVGDYKKLMDKQLNRDNEVGDDLFGDGGWVHGGMNMAGYWFGAGPVGDYYYQATDAAQDRPYNGGRTQGPRNLYSFYQLGGDTYNALSSGSSAADAASAGDTASTGDAVSGNSAVAPDTSTLGSGTYGTGPSYLDTNSIGTGTSGVPDYSGSTPVPSQYTLYNGGGTSMPSFDDYSNSYNNPDMGTLGTGTYGTGYAPTNNMGTGTYDTGVDLGSAATNTSMPSGGNYLDDAQRFMNSGLGKATRAGAYMVNPTLGGILNVGTDFMNGNYAGALKGLGSMYINNQNQRAARQYQNQLNDQASQINNQIGTLNNLYSENSPYSQQLRQEMERKDAASGRRSQYGPREVQLQAALAEKQAGLQPLTSLYNTRANLLTSQAQQNALALKQAATKGQINDILSLYTANPKTGQTLGGGDISNSGGSNPISSAWDSAKDYFGW